MAQRNQIIKALVTSAEARTGSATNTTYGTGGESYDEDYGTYYGIKSAHGSDGTCTASFTGTHTWTTAIDISEIKTKMYAKGIAYGNYGQRDVTFDVEVKQGATWTNVYHSTTHESGTGTTEETNSQTLTVGWEDVVGVRISCSSSAYSYEGTRAQDAYAYGYEVQAFYRVVRSFSGIV